MRQYILLGHVQWWLCHLLHCVTPLKISSLFNGRWRPEVGYASLPSLSSLRNWCVWDLGFGRVTHCFFLIFNVLSTTTIDLLRSLYKYGLLWWLCHVAYHTIDIFISFWWQMAVSSQLCFSLLVILSDCGSVDPNRNRQSEGFKSLSFCLRIVIFFHPELRNSQQSSSATSHHPFQDCRRDTHVNPIGGAGTPSTCINDLARVSSFLTQR